MQLTPEQFSAVTAPGSIVVTAGAGAGKTLMLAERYLFHLREQQLSPLEIVAVTFTDRAANELRARIRRTVTEQLPDREEAIAELEAAQIGTIHSLCARICRDHPDESGAPHSFEVLDAAEDALATARWFDEALDSLPAPLYERIPFSIMRSTLIVLLSDPVTAERALQHDPERWPELAREAQARIVSDLTNHRNWISSIETLRSCRGQDDDLIEAARAAALEAAEKGDLDALAGIVLRGGSAKKWPAGGLSEVKEALKKIRELAGRASEGLAGLAPAPVDDRLAEMLPALREAFRHVRERMKRAKLAARRLDFADLEEYALRALQHEGVRGYYRDRWRAFLVDEFQDTNPIQAEIVESLTRDACLTIVGDEKQSIYGFRRADVAVFREFKARIVAEGGGHQALSLSFRAHVELIGHLNVIFRSVLDTLHAPMEAYRQEAPHAGPHVKLFAVKADRDVNKYTRQRIEASHLAGLIARMIDEGMLVHDQATNRLRPIEPADIAILSRAWDPLDVYHEALAAAGIPAVHMGGGDLFETREAKDIVVLLRFLADPSDDLALIAILRSPFFAVSDPILFEAAAGKDQEQSWWEHLQTARAVELIRAIRVLNALLEACPTTAPSRLLQMANRLTGYSAVIANLPGSERREADWRGMIEWILSVERSVGEDVFALSRRIRRLIEGEVAISRPPLEASEAVSLMTIHGAKGLEWPVVIVPDLARVRRNESSPVYFDAARGVALKLDNEEGEPEKPMLYTLLERERLKREEEEARRLLYVAMTRARDSVVLTATAEKGGLLDLLLEGLTEAGIPVEPIELQP